MGNIHSSWLSGRHSEGDNGPGDHANSGDSGARNDNNNGLILNDNATSTLSSSQDAHPHSLPYELRRTLSRIRRRVVRDRYSTSASPIGQAVSNVLETLGDNTTTDGANDAVLGTGNNASTISLNSRRRRTPEPDNETMDLPVEHESRRARFDSVNNTGSDWGSEATTTLPTPTPIDASEGDMPIYFYFRLQGDGSPTPSGGSSPTRRRSTRLARAAASFFRNPFAASSTHQGSISNINDASSSDEVASTDQSHTLVLVRIQRIAGTPPQATTPPSTTVPSPSADPTSDLGARGAAAGATEDGIQTPMLQWTLYLLVPRPGTSASDNTDAGPQAVPNFDADQTIARAVAIMRALMMGDNMSYEEWMRLQEMLGNVSRGVSKERVEECCAAQKFSHQLSVGIACPICLTDYVVNEPVRTLPCRHSYHTDCIDTWLGSRNNCPLCRQPPVSNPPSPAAS